MLAGLQRERAQHLIGAGGVLDQEDLQLACRRRLDAVGGKRKRHGLSTTEGGTGIGEAGGDRLDRDLQGARQGGSGERVIDVVEAGQGELYLALAGRGAQQEAHCAHAFWAKKRQGWIFITSQTEVRDALRPLQSLWIDLLVMRLLTAPQPGQR